jgi:hypothetical protein
MANVFKKQIPFTNSRWTMPGRATLLKESCTIALANRLVCLGDTKDEDVPQDPPSDA